MTQTGKMVVRRPEDWDQAIRFLEYRKEGELPKSGLEVIVRVPRRTNAQNRYLWGVVYKTLAKGLSERHNAHITADHMHELCRKYFMPQIEIPGLGKTVPMSTTELCKSGNEESFQDYVEQIMALAAERGIFIPDPI